MQEKPRVSRLHTWFSARALIPEVVNLRDLHFWYPIEAWLTNIVSAQIVNALMKVWASIESKCSRESKEMLSIRHTNQYY